MGAACLLWPFKASETVRARAQICGGASFLDGFQSSGDEASTLSPQLGPQAAYVQHSSQTSPQGAAQIFVMAPQVSSSMNPCRHRLDIRSYMLKSPKGFSGVVARCCCISLFSRRAAHDSTANNDLLTKPPWIEQDQAATVTPKARTRCTLQGKEGF